MIKPYLNMDGLVGIYVVGSATRPHRDRLSDYDIEIVVDDVVYAEIPDVKRQVFAYKEGEPKVVDYEFYLWPWSGFVALTGSTQDLFHYPYQHAVILHDPNGKIAPIVARLAALPEGVRHDRMRVHYLEFRFALGRARKTAQRGGELGLRLLRGDALAALVKLLFLAARSWPATHHWTEPELRLVGVSDGLIRLIEETFFDPAPEATRRLVDAVEAWLDERGETFHRNTETLMAWAFHRLEGKQAFERWAGR